MSHPPPLTDPESDLTSFKDMPFEVVRFVKSDLFAFAPPEAIIAAIMLWGSSWHSRPAGSLTNDDRSLMRAAGFGRGAEAAWQAVRDDALRGWIECSDGRLYHPVVAEKVAVSWKSRLKQRHQNYLTAIRMHNSRNDHDPRERISYDAWLQMGKPEDVKASAPRSIQQEMRLESDGDVTRNEAPRYDDVTRNNECKGREGKGREGKGLNINTVDDSARVVVDEKTFDESGSTGAKTISQQTASPPPTQSGRDRPVAPLTTAGPGATPAAADRTEDLMGLTSRLANAGGVSIIRPSAIAREMDIVKGWLADEIDVEGNVMPTIAKRIADLHKDETVGSLAFYDAAIRKRHALAKRTKPSIPAGPKRTIRKPDDPDTRVLQLRAGLKTVLGERTYQSWFDPETTAFSLNGQSVTLTTATAFGRDRIIEHYREPLTAVASDVLNMDDVRVEAQ